MIRSKQSEMSNNIIRLSNVLDNGKLDGCADMLRDAIERAEELGIKKAIVILWDESAEDTEQIKWHQCGLNRREHLRLLGMAYEDFLLEHALDHHHE